MEGLALGPLVLPAFLAGLLTFLAPCTLPLVPGYLSFISGISAQDLQDPTKAQKAHLKIFFNGLFFVVGFSVVFVLLGTLFGAGGIALGNYRYWLERIGGLFVILFGLFMLGLLRLSFLQVLESDHRLKFPAWLKPGHTSSALVFGGTFALGWTPCVGPILGAVLTLAATSGTVLQGAVLLSVFSMGLGIPFLIVAATIGSATGYLTKIARHMRKVEIVGGVFLVFLGGLILFDKFSAWLAWSYELFPDLSEKLLNYL
jgi:cytochrome c-type biogenesis protein